MTTDISPVIIILLQIHRGNNGNAKCFTDNWLCGLHYPPEWQAVGILGHVLQMQKLRVRNESMNHNSSRASQRNNQGAYL